MIYRAGFSASAKGIRSLCTVLNILTLWTYLTSRVVFWQLMHSAGSEHTSIISWSCPHLSHFAFHLKFLLLCPYLQHSSHCIIRTTCSCSRKFSTDFGAIPSYTVTSMFSVLIRFLHYTATYLVPMNSLGQAAHTSIDKGCSDGIENTYLPGLIVLGSAVFRYTVLCDFTFPALPHFLLLQIYIYSNINCF